jgi:MFS family permease
MGILTAISSMTAPVFLVYLKETITKDMALISFLFVPGAFLSLFLPAKMGKLSDRIGRKVMLVSGMILSALFTILIPAAKGYYPIMALYTLLAVSGFISSPAQSAMVTEITSGNQRGRAFGLYQLATGIGGTIGPLLGTAVYQYMGKGNLFYIQGTALIAAAFAVGLIIKERKTDIFKIVKNEI